MSVIRPFLREPLDPIIGDGGGGCIHTGDGGSAALAKGDGGSKDISGGGASDPYDTLIRRDSGTQTV